MQVVRDLAGFSMGQSDNVRRAMSKKNIAIMENYRDLFVHGGTDDTGRTIEGAVARGVPEKVAEKIFDDVSAFAGYAFNKAHAASYAVVAYYTAYMKCFHPTELMAATLNSFRTDISHASYYIEQCKSMGIKILPPDVNKSKAKFTTEGEGTIRIGLAVVKNVGEGAVTEMEQERARGGQFKSFEDFLERSAKIGLKKNMIESLILSSAMDWTGINRASMIATVRTELDKLTSSHSSQVEGQMSLFDAAMGGMDSVPSIHIIKLDDFSESDRLSYEKEMIGIYISGHPLDAYKETIKKFTTFDTLELKEAIDSGNAEKLDDDMPYVMCGVLQAKKNRTTKSKTMMSVLTMEDYYGQYEVALFGRVFEESNFILQPNKSYVIVGKRRIRNENDFSFSADKVYLMPEDDDAVNRVSSDRIMSFALRKGKKTQVAPSPQKNKPHLVQITFDGDPNSQEFQRLLNLLAYFHGNLPVDIKFSADGSVLRLSEVCNVSDNPDILARIIDYCGENKVIIH